MIEAFELSKSYNDFIAVDNVNLNVAPGTVMALLGPNGAGKTTTVRMLTSILTPTSGSARVAGYDVMRQPEQVRAHVGVLTEQHGLYERMKALEYLEFFGRVYGLGPAERKRRALSLMERFGLEDALDKRLGEYSKGMKQKLALTRAMLHNPPVLLLDEPTSAMDPQSARLVRDAVIELQRDARAFLITTHNLSEAQELAHHIAIIRRGRIIASGSFETLSRRIAGDSLMELRIVGEMNGLANDVADLITVEASGKDWLRYRVREPQVVNPALVRRVTDLGLQILTLAPLSRTLEEVYLQIMHEDETKENANGNHR
ncbi:MAG: ABC transporter ATP-binding protein [Anaerolineae bacterium]|nr:ABC transporter ATP-binding protein [Anaerolineae bacterium]